MLRYLALTVFVIASSCVAPTVTAAPGLPVGGFSSQNVQWLGNIAMGETGAEGARRVGDWFYVTNDAGGLNIYDIHEPTTPRLAGTLFLPHLTENEDVDTNGSILLMSQASAPTFAGKQPVRTATGVQRDPSLLHVVDVRDKTAPRVLATLPGGGDHTISCLLDCTWAYGASGYVIDLRDPAAPRISDHSWLTSAGLDSSFFAAHDLVEVSPGIMLSASIPMLLLDARTDPERPRVLAMSEGSTQSFHNAYWPDGGRSRVVVSANEGYLNPRCEARDALASTPLADSSVVGDSAIQTWDATEWARSGRFRPLDQYRVNNGTWTDGEPVAAQPPLGGCSQHYIDPHPAFRTDGWIAAASYGHGVKLLRVDPRGELELAGWFLPIEAATLGAFWITHEIVYAVDFHRGIDVLRVTDAPKSRPSREGTPAWASSRPPRPADIAVEAATVSPYRSMACFLRA